MIKIALSYTARCANRNCNHGFDVFVGLSLAEVRVEAVARARIPFHDYLIADSFDWSKAVVAERRNAFRIPCPSCALPADVELIIDFCRDAKPYIVVSFRDGFTGTASSIPANDFDNPCEVECLHMDDSRFIRFDLV